MGGTTMKTKILIVLGFIFAFLVMCLIFSIGMLGSKM